MEARSGAAKSIEIWNVRSMNQGIPQSLEASPGCLLNPPQQQAWPRHQEPRFSSHCLVLPGADVQEWRPLKEALKAWDLHSFGASSAAVLTLERSLVVT